MSHASFPQSLSRRKAAGRLIALGGAALLPGVLCAQTAFPTKPVTLVVPNAPGGAIDILARLLQERLRTVWNQPVIVEYKPGGGTVVGTDFAAKAAPDGHTICIIATPHVINPAMRQLPFDTVKSLSGITMLGVSNILISAAPSFPAGNLAEAMDLIRKEPKKYNYASPGSGSSMHLAMELLKQRAGLDIVHVPFKGSGPAYPEVMSGRIQLLVDPLFSSMPFVKSGKLKPIAVTARNRSAIAPEVATVAETVPDFNVQSIFGLVVSSGTPREVVQKLYSDFTTVLKRPDTQQRMAEIGMEPLPMTPDQFDAMVKTDIERWTRVVKAANITAD
jgi:tripartite-type tricarboxylate transporter receptor subunit TctC